MTILNKPLKRETQAMYRGKNIIIQLEPPSIVRVKEKGTRTWFETSVEAIYSMAAKAHALEIIKEKKEKKCQ